MQRENKLPYDFYALITLPIIISLAPSLNATAGNYDGTGTL